MRVKPLTLKWRIAIAAAAIAAIHFSFAYVRAWRDRQPRFYPEAWADAVAALKDEVGSDAVDRGLFTIPRTPLSVPRGTVVAGSRVVFDPLSGVRSEYSYTVVADGGRSFLSERGLSYCQFRAPDRCLEAAARLATDDAERLVATLRYLSLTSSTDSVPRGRGGGLDTSESEFAAMLTYVPGRPEEPAGFDDLHSVRSRIGWRLCERLLASPRAQPIGDEKALLDFAREVLRPVIRQRDDAQAAIARPAFEIFARHADDECLPLIKQARTVRQSFDRWNRIKGKPVLGQAVEWLCLCGARPYYGNDGLAAIEAGFGKTSAARVEAIWAKALDPATKDPFRYFEYLYANQPTDCPETLVRNWAALAESRRKDFMAFVYAAGGAPLLARLAADDKSPFFRFVVAHDAFRLTGDHDALAKALALLPGCRTYSLLPGKERQDWDSAYSLLASTYASQKTPEAGTLLRRFLADARRDHASGVSKASNGVLFLAALIAQKLLIADGRDNADAVMDLISACAEQGPPAGSKMTEWPPFFTYDAACNMLGQASDPFVADAVLAYLKSRPLLPYATTQWAFITALAENGDERTLASLEEMFRSLSEPDRSAPPAAGRTQMDLYHDLRRAVLFLRAKTSADTLAILNSADGQDLDLFRLQAVRILARKYTLAQLQSALASDRYQHLRGVIYLAIIERHRQDEAAAVPRQSGEGGR